MPDRSVYIVEQREMDTDWEPTEHVALHKSHADRTVRLLRDETFNTKGVYVYRVRMYAASSHYDD